MKPKSPYRWISIVLIVIGVSLVVGAIFLQLTAHYELYITVYGDDTGSKLDSVLANDSDKISAIMGQQVELEPVYYGPGDYEAFPEGEGTAGGENAVGDMDYFSAVHYQQEILRNVSGVQVEVKYEPGFIDIGA